MPAFELIDQPFAEILRRVAELASIVGHVLGHLGHVGGNAGALFVDIGIGDLVGVLEHRARLVGKPELDAVLEQQRREHGDQQRRHRRDGGEQRDEPDVQPRAGGTAPPRGQHQRQAARDQYDQHHQRQQIADQDQRHHRRRKAAGRSVAPGQDRIARQAEGDNEQADADLEPGVKIDAGHPAVQPPPRRSPAAVLRSASGVTNG